jgi:hypothetical protein
MQKSTKKSDTVVHPLENPIEEKDKVDPVKCTDTAPTYDPVI